MSQIPILYKTIELIGLRNGDYGRMCGVHPTNCGAAARVGIHVKLRKSTISIPVTVKRAITPPVAAEGNTKKRGRPKKVKVEYEEVEEMKDVTTFKAFIWLNGVESCCVGFVSKVFQELYGDLLDGRVVALTAIGSESENESDRRRSLEHNGLATGIIMG